MSTPDFKLNIEVAVTGYQGDQLLAALVNDALREVTNRTDFRGGTISDGRAYDQTFDHDDVRVTVDVTRTRKSIHDRLQAHAAADQDALIPVVQASIYRHEGGHIVTETFGKALLWVKEGKRVARKGWNAEGMFVYLVPEASYPAQTGAAKAHFGDGAMVPYDAYLALKNARGTVSTWVPSVSDCLANDWYEVT